MPKYQDLSQFDESGGFTNPDALPPGVYSLRVSSVANTNKHGSPYKDKNGIPQTMFMFTVKGHENKIFQFVQFNPEAEYHSVSMGRFKQMILAMGIDPTVSGDTEDLVGMTVKANLKVYEGKSQSGGVEMRNSIAGFVVEDGKSDDPSIPTQSGSDPDDDLPF